MSLALVLTLVALNPGERLKLRYFPPGRAVPVAELTPFGPVHEVTRATAASTSLDVIRRAVLRPDSDCLDPRTAPTPDPRRCWYDVRIPAGTLLLATVGEACPNHEWLGWINGMTLTVKVVTWACLPPRGAEVSGAEANLVLLGVPLDRLPHGRLDVRLPDSSAQPSPTSIP